MRQEQKEQETEYSFPYHYVPQYKNGFSQYYSWGWGKQYLSALEFILDEIDKDSANINSIVDIGCGDGRLTKELYERFSDKSILGVDYSEKAINLARVLNPNIEFENVNIIEERMKKQFDAITLVEVFEHIPVELCLDFINSVCELLNDEGVIYMTVPHKNKPVSYKHFQHFDIHTLERYLNKKFDFEEVHYIQRSDRLLSVVNLLMNNKFWIVSNLFLNNFVYGLYKKRYFFARESDCGRIYLKIKKKSQNE